MFSFNISPFLYNLNDNNLQLLNKLNDLILKLSNNVNDNNYAGIVIFMQKNKFDSNNKLIDEIIKEVDESKKQKLIKKIANNNDIDFITSGYTVQLFRIFNNIDLFCIKESKVTKSIICGKEEEIIPNESKPFIYIKIDDLIKKIY